MSECCSSSACETQKPRRATCPVNGKEYLPVPYATILQHLATPWNENNHSALEAEQAYYFCTDPDCDVVYFGEDASVINQQQLRHAVDIKEPNNDKAIICYCYDVSRGQAKANPKIKTYVLEKTKQGLCACDIRNPSGKCCLKNFP